MSSDVYWNPAQEGLSVLARKQPWNLRLDPPFPLSGGQIRDLGDAGKVWMSDTLIRLCAGNSKFAKECQQEIRQFERRQKRRDRSQEQFRAHPELYPERTTPQFDHSQLEAQQGGFPLEYVLYGGAALIGVGALYFILK